MLLLFILILPLMLCRPFAQCSRFYEDGSNNKIRDGCISKHFDLGALPAGASVEVRNECAVAWCDPSGTGQIQFNSCPNVFPPRGCRVKSDKTLSYPECCGDVVCD